MKTTKIFDGLDDYSLENLNRNRPLDIAVEEIIYAYHDCGYDGHGVAVYRDNKDKWHLDEISHCSCNGALDEGFNKISYTKQEILGLLKKRATGSDWLNEDYQAVLSKVEQL